MLFIIALAIAFSFAFFGGNALKKHPYIFYIAAVLLTVGMSFLPSVNTHSLPIFVNNYILGLFTRGAFATALWCVVMITGALPNGSAPMKKLMPVRGELSIFAAILTLGHNIGYGRTYFTMLFTDRGRMSYNQLYASICTIVMLCIMIPLTVMSFPKIRRKMDPKLWKKIQRTAYIFYGLIYIHVLLLTLPMAQAGRKGYTFSVTVYTVVFLGYAFFRIRKAVLKKNKFERKIAVNAVMTFAVIIASIVIFNAIPKRSPEKQVNNNEAKSFSVNTENAVNAAETSTVPKAKSTKNVTVSTASILTSVEAETSETSEITENETSEETETEAVCDEEKDAPENVESEDIPDDDETEDPEESPTETSTKKPKNESKETEPVTKSTTEAEREEPTEIPEPETETEPVTEKETEPVSEPETEPPTEPEPEYMYNNGEFSADAYGYDGDVYVTITIENDVITNITGYSEESDEWYFDSASGQVIPAILASQDADVDAYSGATYSPKAIMEAVKKALEAAKK